MNRDGLLTLCEYDAYANELVFQVVARLSNDVFTRESSPSHGSVYKLLLHTLRTERGFFSLCREQSLPELPDLVLASDIQEQWRNLHQQMRSWIASQSDDALRREVRLPFQLKSQSYSLGKWQLLLQAFVHSIQHRGELSIVLTELGHPLPNLDIILQLVERDGKA